MDIIKLVAAFGLGAVAGVIGGKLYFEKKAEDRADAEIDEVKRHYIAKAVKESTDTSVNNAQPKDVRKYDDISNEKPEEAEKKKYIIKKESVNYNNITGRYFKSEKEENDRAMKEHPEEDMPMEPYEITEEEFSNENREYDKITLSFYDEDEALVDDQEELLEADDTIGSDLLDKFIADDMDIMYIRNNATSADYELKLVYGSFHDAIGIE